MTRKIVLDIETSSYDLNTFSESQQEYLFRYVDKEKDETLKQQKYDDALRMLSIYPYTAKAIVISLFDSVNEKYYTYYENSILEEWSNEEGTHLYKGLTEPEMLESFWRIIDKADQIITFNGKVFDIPFLMLRSAVLRVKPSKNFLKYKYENKSHIDLLEQLTFCGMTKKFNLDFYCQAFGVPSPKQKGINGMEVKNYYEAGKIKEVAMYCRDDVEATYELYKIWNEYLNI